MPAEPQPSPEEWLVESGAFTPEELDEARRGAPDRLNRLAQQTRDDAIADSYSIADAAAQLGITPDELIGRRRVYVFTSEAGEPRVPAWVFSNTTGKLLPGLEEIAAAIPEGWHYASVRGFFRTHQPDLEGKTPSEWLTAGHDVGAVTEILSAC